MTTESGNGPEQDFEGLMGDISDHTRKFRKGEKDGHPSEKSAEMSQQEKRIEAVAEWIESRARLEEVHDIKKGLRTPRPYTITLEALSQEAINRGVPGEEVSKAVAKRLIELEQIVQDEAKGKHEKQRQDKKSKGSLVNPYEKVVAADKLESSERSLLQSAGEHDFEEQRQKNPDSAFQLSATGALAGVLEQLDEYLEELDRPENIKKLVGMPEKDLEEWIEGGQNDEPDRQDAEEELVKNLRQELFDQKLRALKDERDNDAVMEDAWDLVDRTEKQIEALELAGPESFDAAARTKIAADKAEKLAAQKAQRGQIPDEPDEEPEEPATSGATAMPTQSPPAVVEAPSTPEPPTESAAAVVPPPPVSRTPIEKIPDWLKTTATNTRRIEDELAKRVVPPSPVEPGPVGPAVTTPAPEPQPVPESVLPSAPTSPDATEVEETPDPSGVVPENTAGTRGGGGAGRDGGGEEPPALPEPAETGPSEGRGMWNVGLREAGRWFGAVTPKFDSWRDVREMTMLGLRVAAEASEQTGDNRLGVVATAAGTAIIATAEGESFFRKVKVAKSISREIKDAGGSLTRDQKNDIKDRLTKAGISQERIDNFIAGEKGVLSLAGAMYLADTALGKVIKDSGRDVKLTRGAKATSVLVGVGGYAAGIAAGRLVKISTKDNPEMGVVMGNLALKSVLNYGVPRTAEYIVSRFSKLSDDERKAWLENAVGISSALMTATAFGGMAWANREEIVDAVSNIGDGSDSPQAETSEPENPLEEPQEPPLPPDQLEGYADSPLQEPVVTRTEDGDFKTTYPDGSYKLTDTDGELLKAFVTNDKGNLVSVNLDEDTMSGKAFREIYERQPGSSPQDIAMAEYRAEDLYKEDVLKPENLDKDENYMPDEKVYLEEVKNWEDVDGGEVGLSADGSVIQIITDQFGKLQFDPNATPGGEGWYQYMLAQEHLKENPGDYQYLTNDLARDANEAAREYLDKTPEDQAAELAKFGVATESPATEPVPGPKSKMPGEFADQFKGGKFAEGEPPLDSVADTVQQTVNDVIDDNEKAYRGAMDAAAKAGPEWVEDVKLSWDNSGVTEVFEDLEQDLKDTRDKVGGYFENAGELVKEFKKDPEKFIEDFVEDQKTKFSPEGAKEVVNEVKKFLDPDKLEENQEGLENIIAVISVEEAKMSLENMFTEELGLTRNQAEKILDQIEIKEDKNGGVVIETKDGRVHNWQEIYNKDWWKAILGRLDI